MFFDEMVLCAAPVEFWNCHISTYQPVLQSALKEKVN